VQVPADVAFKTPLVMLQPAVPTVVTANEYVPVPEPPDTPRVNPVAYTPFVVVNRTDSCAIWVIVKLTGAKVIA
jgi:hypothetical protein